MNKLMVNSSIVKIVTYKKMSAAEIHLIGKSLALHPPIMIGALCLFMYIRGRFLASSTPVKTVTPIFPFRHV